MKKITILLGCLLAMASCSVDNYDGPNAQFHGSIKDAATGELVGTDIQEGSAIKVYEHGYTNPAAQTWNIKNTGEFRNDMVFAATYDIVFENGNFYPMNINDFVIKAGDNEHDFEVTPYIRVENPSITKNGNTITATFSLEGGKTEVKLSEIQLFAFSDQWVGNSVKYSMTGDNFRQTFSPAVAIDPSTTYTLTIDLTQNTTVFKYTDKNYYFRIGALAAVDNVGTVRYNYAPLVVIKF
jgi:hypothetical protein